MVDLDRARGFLSDRQGGILATLKRDGRPQLSNILVQGRDWYEFVVVDGNADFVEGPGVAQALRDHYRKIRGERRPVIELPGR